MTNLSQPKTEIIENATPVLTEHTAVDTYDDVREDLTAVFYEFWQLTVKCIIYARSLPNSIHLMVALNLYEG